MDDRLDAVERGRSDHLHALASLDDEIRARIYAFIREGGRPVSREDVAAHLGISRKLAAFHLDKLLDRGLLKAGYARPPGRTGPGAGRPAKMYEASGAELEISIPARHYGLMAELLVEAIERESSTVTARTAALRAARERGRIIGRAARAGHGARWSSRRRGVAAAAETLAGCGFEPVEVGNGEVVLRNCPFRSLAQAAPDLVCVVNRAFIEGVLQGLGRPVRARLTRPPNVCCVTLHAEPA
jgi:predicted ArsR family transcriptional regulator